MNLHRVVGGGIILEVSKEKYWMVKSGKIVSYLQPLQQCDVKSLMELFFQKFPNRIPLIAFEIVRSTGFPLERIEAEVTSIMKSGELHRL
ncbi:MAG: hypothetical protein KBH99_06005 [Syntrophobacteraceae bacterium]|nr:hypothetical protein [Syntrophobacteraceae bacterium]